MNRPHFFLKILLIALCGYFLAMVSVVVGLSLVNLSAELREVIGDASTSMYWAQTALIASLVPVLGVLYKKSAHQ
jgi:hypothetical protein